MNHQRNKKYIKCDQTITNQQNTPTKIITNNITSFKKLKKNNKIRNTKKSLSARFKIINKRVARGRSSYLLLALAQEKNLNKYL